MYERLYFLLRYILRAFPPPLCSPPSCPPPPLYRRASISLFSRTLAAIAQLLLLSLSVPISQPSLPLVFLSIPQYLTTISHRNPVLRSFFSARTSYRTLARSFLLAIFFLFLLSRVYRPLPSDSFFFHLLSFFFFSSILLVTILFSIMYWRALSPAPVPVSLVLPLPIPSTDPSLSLCISYTLCFITYYA
jgi:hypothetical protein